MMSNKPLVSVIILLYNSRLYIEKCLDTVLDQDYPKFEVLLVINGNDDGVKEFVESKYNRHRRIKILDPNENLWFSRGNNYAIEYAQGQYIFTLNHDTVLEKDYISKLVSELERNPSAGSATGKLRHYRYSIDSKTRIIDSTGIEIFKTRRAIDRGQWEEDRNQYDDERDIFGASGAAAIYRKSALDEVALPGHSGKLEYFDEDFVAYKEDIDLSWRLQLAGYGCRYVPEAILYHGRSVGRAWPTQFIRFILNRHRQSRRVRRQSFKNHYLMMVKNEVSEVFWRHFIYIFIREILLLIYTLVFEQFQILAVRDFFRELPEARRKRRLIMKNLKISTEQVSKLFHN